MKKLLVIGAAVAMLLLSSCGSKVKCSVCGETKSGKTEEVMGVEISICDDCAEAAEKATEDAMALIG